MLGQAAEHLAPLFPDMAEQFSPGDWRFLGSPVDFVVFDGLTAGAVERVVLVEVKSTDPRLNARQAQISAAITNGKMGLEWLPLRPPKSSVAPHRRARPQIVELPHDGA
jgi:predicted Holliday junction resolvase-like endonuclease